MIRVKSLLILGAVILFLSCSSSQNAGPEPGEESQAVSIRDESAFSVSTDSGVRNVHNTAMQWKSREKFKLELVRKLGGIEESDENRAFHKPSDFALDRNGNLYVVDSGNFRIQKFDPDGSFLDSFGEKGQGPGEFQMMGGIAVDNSGLLYVSDLNTRYIKVLSPEGEELKAFRVSKTNDSLMFLSPERLILSDRLQWGSGEAPKMIRVLGLDGSHLFSCGEVESYSDFDEFRYFNRSAFTTDRDGSLYLAYSTRNRIEKYDPSGQLVMKIDRPLNFEVSQTVEKVMRQVGPRKIEIPRVNMVSSSAAVDEDGRIWVLSNERQLKYEEMALTIVFADEEGNLEDKQAIKTGETPTLDAFAFHVFDPDGVFLGKVPITHHAGRTQIKGDRLFILEPRNEVCLYEYRIIKD